MNGDYSHGPAAKPEYRHTHRHSYGYIYIHMYACVFLHMNSCTGKTWARFLLYLSLPSDLSHVESLNFRLLFTCRQLVTHGVGKLVPPTSPWPSPTLCWHPLRHCFVGFSFALYVFKYLFRMSNKPVSSPNLRDALFSYSNSMQISQLTSLFCWLITICCHVRFLLTWGNSDDWRVRKSARSVYN